MDGNSRSGVGSSSHGLRRLIEAAMLCVALVVWAPTFASAASRSYDSQITGLGEPEAVAVDGGDNVWVSDLANGVLSKFDPYPSNTKLDQQTGGGVVWGGGYQVHSIAASAANEFLYVGVDTEEGAVCGGTPFAIFDNYGNLLKKDQPDYETFGSACQMWFAVNNGSKTDTYGNYYLFTGHAPSILSQYDGYGNPVDFTGSASYIHGNQILGNPKRTFPREAAGSFSPAYSGVAVDPSNGHIWVIVNDYGYESEPEIDEFDSTGIFLRRITAKSSGVPASPTPAYNQPAFGASPGMSGIAVDPTNGDVLVSDRASLVVDEFTPQGKFVGQMTGADTPAGDFGYKCVDYFGDPHNRYCEDRAISIAVNSEGYAYVTDSRNHVVDIFKPLAIRPKITDEPDTNPTATAGTLNATIDPDGGGNVTSCHVDLGTQAEFETDEYKLGPIPCSSTTFSAPAQVHADVSGLTPEAVYHYRFVAANANDTQVGEDHVFIPHKVLGLRADPPSAITAGAAVLNGSFVGNGAHTTYWFEYGTNTSYGAKAPLPVPPGGDAGSPAGPERTPLEAPIGGLKPVTRYHYRVVAENGSVSKSADLSFRTEPLLPQSKGTVSDVHSEQLVLHAQINPGGADTTYNFEYGTEKCSEVPDPCTVPFADTHIGSNVGNDTGSKKLTGLEPATIYHYRVVTTNSVGTSYSPERTFTTYPFRAELKDSCPNVLARQQTGAALLSDCRGYELVSSANAGGYDVESNLVPGQTPFEGYPRAEDPIRVLYGVHNGAIPGVSGNPTNRGVDPYVATRGTDGWTTSYVGIPANNPFAATPFSSTLADADAALDSLAYGGPDICSPCFADGTSGVPLHLQDGSLVQGMHGSIEPSTPATSDGLVKKHLSADGSHLVFSSTSQFEPAGNNGTGDVSIYDRNLGTGTTQVVSTDSSGSALTCLQGAGTCHAPGDGHGIAELDISEDGSRIVTGQLVSTDALGNDYYRLHMHIGSSANSADLTPGAVTGALYDGMTADGSKVYFTTKDHLLGTDTDASSDIYEAGVSSDGAVTLRLVTTKGGTASNDDGCNPPGIPTSWNTDAGEGKCNAVAFAGGAGVASGNGTLYFLSPELLDSAAEADGEEGEPNLYVSKVGSDPEFVATIDTSTIKPPPLPHKHVVSKLNFLTGRNRPEDIAVDQNSGDVYVAEAETGELSRWNSNGTAHKFSALGSNKLGGQNFGFGEGQVAVDSSSSPFKGDFYVTSNGGSVDVYANNGEHLGEITGFNEACGVAVDQSNGDVYVGSYPYEVRRFRPVSAAQPVSNSSYEEVEGIESLDEHCNIDASAEGHVYSWPYYGGLIEQFERNSFTTTPFPSPSGTSIGSGLRVESDPLNGDLYVDEGGEVARYDSAGNEVEKFGAGVLSGESRGVGVNGKTEHIYVSDGSSVIDFGYPPPYEPIDNPAVLHAMNQAGTHDWSDFQVSPSGQFAAFTTRLPIDESFDNLEHAEVYRFNASTGSLDCVSCPATNAIATADAGLATNGLSLADDGRVFFDSGEAIVLRDGDNRADVYEWEEQGTGNCDPENPNFFPTEGICLGLISSGTSPFDSRLLSVTADGGDALFFTHDSLASQDENGPITKLYDARVNGGFFSVPPRALCAASDECHGPGTTEAPIPPIRTKAGTPGNGTQKGCKKGFIKRHGRCVHKKQRKHRRHQQGRHH